MARIASQAVAGFYPTPPHLLAAIGDLVRFPEYEKKSYNTPGAVLVDPCAGEGDAILSLVKRAHGGNREEPDVYTCELEATRHAALHKKLNANVPGIMSFMSSWRWQQHARHGDAFRLSFGPVASLLYLNPPYDTDREHGRVEQKFLVRFTDALATNGVLLFVVPHYALKASAAFLATHFDIRGCHRFPEADFDAFKQVVLVATKRVSLFEPDARVRDQVLAWAESVETCPSLAHSRYVERLEPAARAFGAVEVPCFAPSTTHLWEMRTVDLTAIRSKFQAWTKTQKRGVRVSMPEILPELPVQELLLRRYPVATPPRPAHIAAGIAAGLFNGERIEAPGLPPLLVKGVFDREWRDVEQKIGKDGEVKGVVQVQAPKLVTTVLDLSSYKYHTLGTEQTGSKNVSEMGVADLLNHYGKSLATVMERNCPIGYDPRIHAPEVPLADVARPLFHAQAHAARAIVRLLGGPGKAIRKGKAAILLGELGCLHGDTPIFDPIAGTTLTVAVRCLRREPFHVWALGPHGPVIAAAMLPVKYAAVQMLRVTMDNGRSVTVTPAHRFWNGEEWIPASRVCELLHEAAPVLLASSSDSVLSARAQGGSRWTRTAPDSPGDCLNELHSDDERLLSDPGIGQAPVPSQDDALGRSRYGSHEDASEPSAARSRSYRSPGHHSRSSSSPSCTTSPSDESSRLRRRLRTKRVSSSIQAPSRLPVASSPVRRDGELSLSVLVSTVGVPHATSDASGFGLDPHLTQTEGVAQVISVEPLPSEPYYDFHVPVFNNYWAEGLWHHNSGKSGTALAVAKTINAKRTLILCPPHLLQSWTNEIRAVVPEAEIKILRDVANVEALTSSVASSSMPATSRLVADSRPVVAILSREAAKLGHGWVGVSLCPRCGSEAPPGDMVKLRQRCEAKPLKLKDELAQSCAELAVVLEPHAPENPRIAALLCNRAARKRQAHYTTAKKTRTFRGIGAVRFDQVLGILMERSTASYQETDTHRAILHLLHAIDDDARTAYVARAFLVSERPEFGRKLLTLVKDAELRESVVAEARTAMPRSSLDYGYRPTNDTWARHEWKVLDEAEVLFHAGKYEQKARTFDSVKAGSMEAAVLAMESLVAVSQFAMGSECGEFLFQAVPEPRRLALAKYITRRHSKFFDFIIMDEAQDANSTGSGQEISYHRLTGLGIPVLGMTGSFMNGYAESVFANMQALAAPFRDEFGRDEHTRFVDRYGYRKRILEDKEDGEVVEFGTVSDRVQRCARITGDAPGILPVFLFKHLLPVAVTLHKADLALDLPTCTQAHASVKPSDKLQGLYDSLKEALVKQIKKDMFVEGLAGKLFGQLSELPSYLDRATEDVGNTADGSFEIRYPASVGGELVARVPPLPRTTILPKERWLLDTLKTELAEGRNVMVFGWHLGLLPRLSRIIEAATGEKAPILYAAKVPTAKRQEWIEREIVAKKRRVMVANPVCIQTGLNNLVHFSTEIWCENPSCSPIIARQAIGRVDRIGQKRETRILFATYGGTLQTHLYDLLMAKVAVSIATDGLDPESAIRAAGVGHDDVLASMSIGRQLWAMLTAEGSPKPKFEQSST
jgi:hypothetical protein